MKIYKGYLIKNLFKPLIISLATLTAIIWSSRVVKFMDYIVQDGADFLSFFKMTMYVLPSLVLMILPLTMFLTTILTYNKLIENREIIILKNCGVKKIQLLSPLLILAVIITICSYSISLYGGYRSSYEIRKLRSEIQNNISFSIIKEGAFTSFKNLVIYADEIRDNKAYNIMIYNKSEDLKKEKNLLLQAKSAELNDNIITLYNGNFQRFTNDYNDGPDIVFFKEYNTDFQELSGEQATFNLRLDSISTIKLIEMLLNLDKYRNEYNVNKIIYEVNYRLTFPLTIILIAFLSGSLMLDSSFNRISTSKITMKTSIASILTYIISLSLYQKVEDNSMFLIALYIFIIAVLIFSFNLIKEKKTI